MKKIYLAIPYSGMEQSSFEQANEAATKVLKRGHNVFSPISHSHILANTAKLPGTWAFWEKIDMQFLDWADEIWVLVPKEGYSKVKNSVGVTAEIDYAIKSGKTVKFVQLLDNKLQYYQTSILD